MTIVNGAGVLVKQSDKIKLLGSTLDNKLTLTGHVNAVCKETFFHIRALRHIRRVLTEDTAKIVVCALVGSRLDYANSIMYEVSTNCNVCKTSSPGLSSSREAIRA